MKSDEPDQIDGILEQALSNYSKQEPRPGFEDRALQYVYAADARRRFVLPGWAFAAALAALLLILLPVARIHHDPTSDHFQASGRAELKPPAPDRLSMNLVSQAPASRERRQRAVSGVRALSLPRQQEFPAPSPITEEERELLLLAVSAPEEALKISTQQTQPEIAPIEVEGIDIKPLRIDGLQQGAGE